MRTDWERVDALDDAEIDLSDIPEISTEKFGNALVRAGLAGQRRQREVTVRLDADVLEWFRSTGSGYEERMNAVLRAYIEAHRPK